MHIKYEHFTGFPEPSSYEEVIISSTARKENIATIENVWENICDTIRCF